MKIDQISEVYDPEYEHDTDDHVVKHKDDNGKNFWAVYNHSGEIVKVFYDQDKAKSYAEKNHDALMKDEIVAEKWSKKYKRSINCNNPKGFSQKAHCQGRKKNENINEAVNEELYDFDKEQPMQSTVAVPGYGTMSIDGLMKNLIQSVTELLGKMKQGTSGMRAADYELNKNKVLTSKLAALIQALDDLQAIRAKGGARSRNIQQEAEQQPLPVDMDRIRDKIQQFESKQYITPQEADNMRRSIQSLASGRKPIYPEAVLQLLTIVT